jgi:hypothetical protein
MPTATTSKSDLEKGKNLKSPPPKWAFFITFAPKTTPNF